MVELPPLIQYARYFASITLLYYCVHHPQGCIAQTLTGPLWGAVFFLSGATALGPNILWSAPPSKIHHRVNMDGIPINARNHLCLADL